MTYRSQTNSSTATDRGGGGLRIKCECYPFFLDSFLVHFVHLYLLYIFLSYCTSALQLSLWPNLRFKLCLHCYLCKFSFIYNNINSFTWVCRGRGVAGGSRVMVHCVGLHIISMLDGKCRPGLTVGASWR